MKRKIVYLLAALLLPLGLLALHGCRPSPALTQIVFNQDEKEDVSDADEMMSNRADNTLADENIPSVAESEDSERTRNWDNVIAQYGHSEEDSGERAADVEYNTAGSELYTSAQAPDESQREESSGGEETGDVREEEGTSQTGSDTETPDAVVTEDTAGSTDENEGEETSGDNGAEDELPAASTAAATGQAAVLVQMLGGEGVLVAASEDFSQNALLQAVFAGEGADAVQALWSGDGSTPMTDQSFEALLALAPDVCFVFTGQEPFTEAQQERLEAESAIRLVKLPPLTGGEAILTAVSVVAEVLGDRTGEGGQDAAALAERYAAWYDGVLEQAAWEDEDSLYTLYISGYDDNVVYRLVSASEVLLEQEGLPIVSKASASAVGDFLSVAGVKEMAALNGTALGRLWYVHPFSGLGVNKSVSNAASGVSFNNTNGSQVQYLTSGLGSASYPALVVASADIRDKLQSAALWQPGLTLFYRETRSLSSDIEGAYDIYVIPAGVGSWAEGSAESPLLALWAAWRFRGSVTEDAVRDAVKDFYHDFYHYALSAGEIDQILND